MSIKSRLKSQLNTIRGITEQTLSVFETPQQWTHKVHEQANHALWFAGHMGMMDEFLMRGLAPERTAATDDYREKFGMGSKPSSDPADYPPVEEVLAFMRERRATLLADLEEMDEARMEDPAPKETPPFMTDLASMFEAGVWHEALHLGQVTVARRDLGFAPMADSAPKA